MATSRAVPAWFSLSNYADLENASYLEWFEEFAARAKLHQVALAGRASGELCLAFDESTAGTWEHIKKYGSASSLRRHLRLAMQRKLGYRGEILPYLPVRSGTTLIVDQVGFIAPEVSKPDVQRHLVSIDLSAPDEVILVSFQRWLSEARKGAQAVPAVSSKNMNRWVTFQLLAFIDLYVLARAFDGVKLKLTQVGNVLYPEEQCKLVADRLRKVVAKDAEHVLSSEFLDAFEAQLRASTAEERNRQASK